MNNIILSLEDLTMEESFSFIEEIYNERLDTEQELIWGLKLTKMLVMDGCHIIKFLKTKGFRIMADMKLFDIGNTNEVALMSYISNGADIVTVHCSSLHKTTNDFIKKHIAGITVLTSFTDEDVLSVYNDSLSNTIYKLSDIAGSNEFKYLVCSATDIQYLSPSFRGKKICPGIRPTWSEVSEDDQNRYTTPEKAKELGADYLVVGRPITKSKNMIDSLLRLNEELELISK